MLEFYVSFFLFSLLFFASWLIKPGSGFSVFAVANILFYFCYALIPFFIFTIEIPYGYDRGWFRDEYLIFDVELVSYAMLWLVLAYTVFLIGFLSVRWEPRTIMEFSPKVKTYVFYLSASLLLVGIVSFLVYLQSLGSVVGGYLANNRMLYEGDKVDVVSSVSFLRNFSSLMLVSTYLLWASKHDSDRTSVTALFYLGLVSSFIYLFYTSGRMSLIVFLAVFFFSRPFVTGKRESRVGLAALVGFALFMMLFGKSVFRVFIYEDALQRSFESYDNDSAALTAFWNFVGDFTFPLKSILAAFVVDRDWLLFKDFVFSFTYLFPARLFPIIENTTLYNTKNVMGEHIDYTNIPSDVFSYGYLNLGYIGFFMVPFLYGMFCRWFGRFDYSNNKVAAVLFVKAIFVLGFRVMYFDPKHLLKGNFELVMVFLLLLLVVKLTPSRARAYQ